MAQVDGFTHVWVYDNAGNILYREEYSYTTGELGDMVDGVAYTYGDEDWGDLLTAYDGQTITYDEIGNPLNDGTWNYNWQHGRELSSMTDGTVTWSYTYNADGLRTKRTNGTTSYSYVYLGGELEKLTVGTEKLAFAYDAEGTPLTVRWNGTYYFYLTNLQGDVIAITDETGTIVVQYTYDAWGNPLTATGTLATTLGQYNPLRYRGYVYDQETGLYYLQTRYYNPKIGRFINADGLIATGQGLLGNNMFAYCNNNPVNYTDPTGELAFPGEIHNQVVTYIKNLYNLYSEQIILYKKNSKNKYGRADLISENGEVWDVKRDKKRQIRKGVDQVAEYVSGVWANSPDQKLSVGGMIPSGYFYYKSGLTTYRVTYRYAGDGIIAYDYEMVDYDYETVLTTAAVFTVAAVAAYVVSGPIGVGAGIISSFLR